VVIDLLEEAQLHREVYIALLQSALRVPGSKRQLAQQVGITPQYLSYLCDPYDAIHTPSPALAARIAAALPLDVPERQAVLEHMLLARERRLAAERSQRTIGDSAGPVEPVLQQLRAAHQAASFTPTTRAARHAYGILHLVSRQVVEKWDPRREPLACVEAALLLHDAACVLNRPSEALYYAKWAQAVLAPLDARAWRSEDQTRFDHYRVNVWVAEAVAHHNLGLYQPEAAAYMRAEAELAEVNPTARAFWVPHLARGEINALRDRPRFTLSEVDGLARQARAVCERRDDPGDKLLLLLLNEAEGRAYLRYGSLEKAGQMLRGTLETLDKVPASGALHHVMVLKTVAWWRWAVGDQTEWRHFIELTLRTAITAGLAHQVAGLRQAYGPVLEPVLTMLPELAPDIPPGTED
jgi:transcriptional regulator with XRE-family HTH domain